MIAILIPGFHTEAAAMTWLHRQGHVIHAVLTRGWDGLVRGSALLRRPR